jgi:hypothetical protein
MIFNIFFYFLIINNPKNRMVLKNYIFNDLSKNNLLQHGLFEDQRFNNITDNKHELYRIKEYLHKNDILKKLQSNKISKYDKLKIIEENDILKKNNPFDDIINDFNKEFN